jgi:hypothetical protein
MNHDATLRGSIRAGASAVVLLLLGASVSGCGETKVEEEARARRTAQEEQAKGANASKRKQNAEAGRHATQARTFRVLEL